MSQRNIQPTITVMNRPAAVDALLQLRGIALFGLLALVLLISHGGAG